MLTVSLKCQPVIAMNQDRVNVVINYDSEAAVYVYFQSYAADAPMSQFILFWPGLSLTPWFSRNSLGRGIGVALLPTL